MGNNSSTDKRYHIVSELGAHEMGSESWNHPLRLGDEGMEEKNDVEPEVIKKDKTEYVTERLKKRAW